MLALSSLLEAGSAGSRVQYVGGTVAGIKTRTEARIDCVAPETLAFHGKSGTIEIPYRDINTIEYGMRVSRRYMEAILISPIFLVAKRRTHFLTIGYSDSQGQQQAMVLEVGKEEIRSLLVSLEARTGRRVEYQDEEARKAGRG